jgi:hypothetical protein
MRIIAGSGDEFPANFWIASPLRFSLRHTDAQQCAAGILRCLPRPP